MCTFLHPNRSKSRKSSTENLSRLLKEEEPGDGDDVVQEGATVEGPVIRITCDLSRFGTTRAHA